MEESFAGLRDELSRLTGPARVPTLTRLGHNLAMRYWRIGPGRPAALGDLSGAIEAWDEAYRLLDPGDPARGEAATRLGWLLAARYGAHGSGPEDRETGIFLLDEAVRLFREVLAGPPLCADVTATASTLRTVAESLQSLFSGDFTRPDLDRLAESRLALERLSREGVLWVWRVPSDPPDHPASVMRGDAQPSSTVPPGRPGATASGPPTASAPSTRRVARDRLAALVADGEAPAWKQVRALLLADPRTLAAGDLDAFLGAAVNAADARHADADDELSESGLDRLLSAVGLCLRGRRDGSRWAGDDEDPTGRVHRTAGEQLLAATTLVPPDHPAASVVVEAVGGLLDDVRPLSGVIIEIADGLLAYAEKIPFRHPTVVAIAELCRTVTALRAGAATDPDAFATAVAAVPTDHPVRRTLCIAVEHARLVAAVRANEPITADPSLGIAADLLNALLRDDRAALRAAVDAVTGEAPPRVCAVLGAIRLRLAEDLGAAIALLSRASRALDDEGLRTRTWWRLAEAYRKRGAAGDSERSRDAGLSALRGPGPDQRSAARFAGWMLADGRGVEAFTALEIAAACPEPPPADPLALDVVSLLVGLSPQAEPPPEAPSPASVAAGVRTIGATALLYLHPTDDARRTAGVLCLDPATDRLDVLANVPATDPLTSDDPGWPAVLGRWTSGHLLVAATGGLDRLALPAVRVGDGRRLVQDVVVSYVPAGAQVVRLAARTFAPLDAGALFVVNPREDRDPEMSEVKVIRRLFYPRSICLGRGLESVDAAGTADDVLRYVPAASLVHLACGLRDAELQLAGGDVLDGAALRGIGGLVILSEGSAPTLLDAGFAGVVGWQWAVPVRVAALALFMVHLQLIDIRRPPAAAVNAVQRWMLDPDRILPPVLTGVHRDTVTTVDLTRPALWASLAYHGR